MRWPGALLACAVSTLPVSFAAYGQQTTTGYCSPIISNVTGNVTTNCVVTVAALKNQVQENLDNALTELKKLYVVNMGYMLPSMTDYIRGPSKDGWTAVRQQAIFVSKHLSVAVESVVSYNASLGDGLGDDLAMLNSTLRRRADLIMQLPDDPPSVEWAENWSQQYSEQVRRLRNQITDLDKKFKSSSYKPG